MSDHEFDLKLLSDVALQKYASESLSVLVEVAGARTLTPDLYRRASDAIDLYEQYDRLRRAHTVAVAG